MGRALRAIRSPAPFSMLAQACTVRTILGSSGALLGSTLLASPAMANCAAVPNTTHFVCDGSTGPTRLAGITGFESVTFLNGQTSAVSTGLDLRSLVYPNVNFAMDATSTPTPNGTGSLTISAQGNVTTTTPYHTGINGNLITSAAIALNAVSTAGGTINMLQGATSTITGDTGISLATTGGPNGNVVLVTNGTIDSRVTGINVNATGTSSITANGEVTGTAGSGISTTSTGLNTVTIGNWTRGGTGVEATSTQSNVLITNSGAITAYSGLGISAKADGYVRVVGNGSVAGMRGGIVVASGANATDFTAVTGFGRVTAISGDGINVSNAGAFDTVISHLGAINARFGNGVTLNNTGTGAIRIEVDEIYAYNAAVNATIAKSSSTALLSIDARGDLIGTSSGIIATNYGSGNTVVTAAGRIDSRLAGISVMANGSSSVTARGDILAAGSSAIQTVSEGFNSVKFLGSEARGVRGIQATSIGSNTDITVEGTITGFDGAGIFTQAAGYFRITNNGAVSGTANGITGEAGIAASAYSAVLGSGPVTASAGNAIHLSNASSHGTVVSQPGPLTAAEGSGVFIDNTGSGASDIWVLTGEVTAKETGIDASINNTDSTGLIFIDATRNLTADTGIVARSSGSGNISVDTAGAIDAQTVGIWTRLTPIAGRSNGTVIDVKTGSSVTAAAPGSVGILTNSGLSTGTSTVFVRGTVQGSEGVRQIALAGTNDTTNAASGLIDGINTIVQSNADGLNSVTNDGIIRGTAVAIDQTTSASGNAQVLNKGTITGPIAIKAALAGGAYRLRNELGGVLNGSVQVAGSNASESNFTNTGIWNAVGASSFSGSASNSGLLNLAAGGSIGATAGMVNSATGTLAFAGGGRIAADLTNAGLITLPTSKRGRLPRWPETSPEARGASSSWMSRWPISPLTAWPLPAPPAVHPQFWSMSWIAGFLQTGSSH